MKRTILTAIVWGALSISATQAAELTTIPSVPVTPAPGSPGTATPTPYPQITPRALPKPVAGSSQVTLSAQRNKTIANMSRISAQKMTGAVETLLTGLGFNLTAVPDSHLCCGSAGTYSFFKQKTAYEIADSDWSSDVCSSDLSPSSPAWIQPDGGSRQPPVLRLGGHLFADPA